MSVYYKGLAERFNDWPAISVLAGETSRRADDLASAKRYLAAAARQSILANEGSARLIQARLEDLDPLVAAQARIQAFSPLSERVVIKDDTITPPVELLQKAFALLSDDRGPGGFAAAAGLHGIPLWFNWNWGHNSRSSKELNLFLPWNRAFLLNMERAAKKKVKSVNLLCWDFTNGKIPKAFSEPLLSEKNSNPLFAFKMDLPQSDPPIQRYTFRDFSKEILLPDGGEVDRLFEFSDWHDFSLALENINSTVHAVVGGDMASVGLTSYDPLYYAVLCEIDRLWALWQLKHMPFESAIDKSLLDVILDPFNLKVRDVLDIKKLNYSYPDPPNATNTAKHG